jgi:sulfite reductase (NADPH) flavoprotein alpha-component
MLQSPKKKVLDELLAASTREELFWLHGYLEGLLREGGVQQETVVAKTTAARITIAYGTETGNAKRLATDFAAKAKKRGLGVKLTNLDQYKLPDLLKEEYFVGIISTHGDGEPPAGAKKFFDHLHSSKPSLQNLKYGIVALGDSSYPLFCKAGDDVDVQLAELGGKRIVPAQRCDTDYEEDADRWFGEIVSAISDVTAQAASVAKSTTLEVPRSTGKKTYTGRVLVNVNLNDLGSLKQTHHIEIAAEGVAYEPGDALGIVPRNPATSVAAILSLAGKSGDEATTFRNEETTVQQLLERKLNIVSLPARVVKKYAALVEQSIPDTTIGLEDLLKIYPLKRAEDFDAALQLLEPIAPRLYSISSSPAAHQDEVHLTIARNQFYINEQAKYGLCSDYMCGFPVGLEFEFYIHRNTQFRLPAADKDVIMIGPGTGIAPFRSFLAHRDAEGSSGKNWLFFGDQQFATDFLYQTEVQNWFDTGVLTQVNTAFSRDQPHKVYVQHKIKEQAESFWSWLEEGAHIYVCGSKEGMSRDVETAILNVIQNEGGMTENAALDYLQALKEESRYLQDVY